MKIILDLDGLVYKAAFSAEKTLRHVVRDGKPYGSYEYYKDMVADLDSDGLWDKAKHRPLDEKIEIKKQVNAQSGKQSIAIASSILNSIFDRLGTSSVEGYLSGDTNFRYELYPYYKANRADLKKPVNFTTVRDYFIDRFKNVTDGIEADDAVSIAAWKYIRIGLPFVISSTDKDLLQIPGNHYNHDKDVSLTVDPYTADYNFYTQLLTGDKADNIPGIDGIGPAKAKKILVDTQDEVDMFEAVSTAYKNAELPYSDLERNAKLLYLLRDYNDEWRPPK